ncbi:MAG: methionyl-tRNA formyltransferase [Actinobacteria bacterium]|nr:methionyl-tRNA formyltransferase [Actinomycetota bacterium]MBU1943898.1 methionyl-tRNA formyltransferase [Actinomycetota bacterium]MBU2688580.1 methionyl-tRNA formyltransferase [Actinomycetota bacterium]
MRVLFFGSDAFAREPFSTVLESSHEVVGVVSRPDRPAGRGRTASPTPISEAASGMGIALWKPEALDDERFRGGVEALDWDAGVLVAYGALIPRWLLDLPPHGFINLHPSLLPRFRGAAPVQRAIMGGASITGVTTIRMTSRLDAGDILMHRELPIGDEDTAGTLAESLSHAGAGLLVETLDAVEGGRLEPVPQEEDKATEAPPISVAEGDIDWERPAEEIWRLVRALNPEPGAYTFFRDRRVKVWETHLTDVPPEDDPGTLMLLGKEGLLVNTGTACLQIDVVQPEGKQRMSAGEFTRGQRILIDERFSRCG